MKKIITVAFFSLIWMSTFAQQIKKESIDSGGGIATGGTLVAIHTIGETVIAEKSATTLQVSEGFISPDLLNNIGVQDFTLLAGVTAYPNPTTDILNISFPNIKNYSIQVFDLLGKQISSTNTINQETYMLDVTNLQTATYLVLIKNEETKQYKTFKIVKK